MIAHVLKIILSFRFPSPSRSIHLGDVSEPNGRKTPHIFAWTTWPARFGRAELWGLGTRQGFNENFKISWSSLFRQKEKVFGAVLDKKQVDYTNIN